MNLKEIIYKAANDYAAIEWDHIQTQIKAGLSPHVVSVTSEAFSAGADFGFRKALEMLRSEEAYNYYNSESDGCAPFNGANPKQMADWLQGKMRVEKVTSYTCLSCGQRLESETSDCECSKK